MRRECLDRVSCHSGYTYPERPLAFLWEGVRLHVKDVYNEWNSPDGRVFQVETREGGFFTLTYFNKDDDWEITPVGL